MSKRLITNGTQFVKNHPHSLSLFPETFYKLLNVFILFLCLCWDWQKHKLYYLKHFTSLLIVLCTIVESVYINMAVQNWLRWKILWSWNSKMFTYSINESCYNGKIYHESEPEILADCLLKFIMDHLSTPY